MVVAVAVAVSEIIIADDEKDKPLILSEKEDIIAGTTSSISADVLPYSFVCVFLFNDDADADADEVDVDVNAGIIENAPDRNDDDGDDDDDGDVVNASTITTVGCITTSSSDSSSISSSVVVVCVVGSTSNVITIIMLFPIYRKIVRNNKGLLSSTAAKIY